MLRTLRIATMAECAGAVLIAASIGAGTAAADDKWQLAVSNTGDIPVKVVVLDASSFRDITDSRSPEFIPKGSGTVKVKQKGAYHVEVFAKGDVTPCWKQRGFSASTSSVTVHCEHTMAQGGGQPQNSGPQQSGSGSPGSGQPPKTPVLYPQSVHKCSMTELRPDGTCPPKTVQPWGPLRNRLDEANQALDQADRNFKALNEKDRDFKKKIADIEKQITDAEGKIKFVQDALGPGEPAENIDYVKKTKKKAVDLKAKLETEAGKKLGGCVPGKPENAKDTQGNENGPFDGTTGGCKFTHDIGK